MGWIKDLLVQPKCFTHISFKPAPIPTTITFYTPIPSTCFRLFTFKQDIKNSNLRSKPNNVGLNMRQGRLIYIVNIYSRLCFSPTLFGFGCNSALPGDFNASLVETTQQSYLNLKLGSPEWRRSICPFSFKFDWIQGPCMRRGWELSTNTITMKFVRCLI